MGRRLQTIYEYLGEESKEKVNQAIMKLSKEEKETLTARYGKNLDKPKTGEKWNTQTQSTFYNQVIPKLREMLNKEKSNGEKKSTILVLQKEIKYIQSPDEWLLRMIKEGKSNQEICKILQINQQELYNKLLNAKNSGFSTMRTYYSDGSICYKNIDSISKLKEYRKSFQADHTIITEPNETELKVLAISDLHFGNKLERLDAVEKAFQYCKDNDIHIILCGGDLIDGTHTRGKQKIKDPVKQLDYFLDKYPHDDSILTFAVGGDHDMDALTDASLDIIEICKNYRHDIIVGNYNNTAVHLKNDEILLYHFISGGNIRKTKAPIILHGHSHKFNIIPTIDHLDITIPTLSDILGENPSALEINLHFKKGLIAKADIKRIVFEENTKIINNSTFDLSLNHSNNYNNHVENEEHYKGKRMVFKRDCESSRVKNFKEKYGIR